MPMENIRKIGEVLRSLDAVMLTTVDETDQLVSRPMMVCVGDFDGTLWFFAPMKSRFIANVSANPNVNIAYSGPLTSLSVAGTATFVPSLARVSTRWHNALTPWFPDGMGDVAMIEITVDEARLWNISPSSPLGLQLDHPTNGTGSGRRRNRL